MNIDTGKLRMLDEGEIPNERELSVAIEELTEKQKDNMEVSLKDNRSKAGKKLQAARQVHNLSKNQKRNQKNWLKKNG